MDYAELTRLLDAHKQSISTQLAETKDALAEFKAKGFVDPETKEKLTRLEAKGEEITTAYKDFREKELKTLKDDNALIRKDLDEALVRLNRKTVNGGVPGLEGMKTYGQAFAESQEFTDWRAKGKQGPVSVELQKYDSSPNILLTPGKPGEAKSSPGVGLQSSVVSGGTQGQWFAIAPYAAPGIHRPPDLPLAVRSVTPSAPMSGNTLWYVREKAPYDFSTYTADYQVLYGDKKKLSTIVYETMTQPVSTIAHYIKVPTQMLDDVPALQADINNRLMYGLGRKEDLEFLYGDGTNGHISGIVPAATAFNKTAWDTAHPSSTALDYLAGMLSQLSAQGFMATAIMVPPTAFWSMSILKSTTGAYLLGGPVQAAELRIWGVRVVLNYQMTAGTALVGDFQDGAEIFDRMTATIATANQNEDDFIRNQITIRAEERVALAVFIPSAFVTMSAFPAQLEGEGGGTPQEKPVRSKS
jgi:HK97 family phage major capsid protein